MNPDLGVYLSPTIPLTILTEIGVLFLWSRNRTQRWDAFPLRLVILTIANLVTQFILITALVLSPFRYWPTLLLTELLILFIEAEFLIRTGLSRIRAIKLSLFLNLTSFGIGLFLPF